LAEENMKILMKFTSMMFRNSHLNPLINISIFQGFNELLSSQGTFCLETMILYYVE